MSANVQSTVNENRHELQDVLPLKTPYSVFIDVCNACNFKCKFCAAQYAADRRGYETQVMSFEMFKKIVDRIETFGEKLKILRLYGNGEPLLNKDFSAMVSYARDKKIANWIETVTNGSMLSPDLNRKLVKGLDRIRISIEGVDAEAYQEVAGVTIDWVRFVENIRDLYQNRDNCEIYIKTVDASVDSPEKKEKFFNTFGNICDKIFIENLSPIWPDYDELDDYFQLSGKTLMKNSNPGKMEVCPFPFYQMFIHSDGTVVPCCADWQQRLPLGNSGNTALDKIWEGDSYHMLQMDMLEKGRRCRDLCSSCLYPECAANDNIDDYREELLRKYRNL